MASWLRKLTDFVLEEAHPTRLLRLANILAQVLYHTARKSWEDNLGRRAAALAFFTLLNILPLGCLLLFFLSRSLPFQTTMATAESALVEQLVTPAAQKVVLNLFDHLSTNLSLIGKGLSGAVALLVLLMLGTTLIVSVERTLNEIWRAPSRGRAIVARISLLWIGVALMPVLVAGSFALSAHFKRGMPRFYLTLHYFVPFLITFAAFLALYWVTPRVRPRFRAAALASFVATSFFEGAKLGVNQYVQLVFSQSTVEKLYGSLALLPIGMVWIYYSWIILLAGAELAYVLHHRARLQSEARLREMLGRGFTPLSRLAAIALVLEACNRSENDLGPLATPELAARYGLHPDQVERWFSALTEAGFTVRAPSGGIAATRPAREMGLLELSDLFERKFHGAFADAGPAVRAWARAEREAFVSSLGEKTLAEWAVARSTQEFATLPAQAGGSS